MANEWDPDGIQMGWRGKPYRDGCKGSITSQLFLKPQEYITAVMTDKVTIVNGKLEGNDVRIMLDSGSSVSLINKGSLPKQCTLSGKMPQL